MIETIHFSESKNQSLDKHFVDKVVEGKPFFGGALQSKPPFGEDRELLGGESRPKYHLHASCRVAFYHLLSMSSLGASMVVVHVVIFEFTRVLFNGLNALYRA